MGEAQMTRWRAPFALLFGLVLVFGATAQAHGITIRTENPTASYLSRTTKVDFSGMAGWETTTSVTSGGLTVTFDKTMTRNGATPTWGEAGQVEEVSPARFYYYGPSPVGITLDRPVYEFGFEAGPETAEVASQFDVTFTASNDGHVVDSVTQTISAVSWPWNFKARLFAISSDVPFDKIDIAFTPDNVGSAGLALAQIRYADTEPSTVSGTVKSAATGVPVPFAELWVENAGMTVSVVEADAHGAYSVELPSSDYTVHAQGPGWSDAFESISVTGTDITLDFALTDHYEQAVYRFFNKTGGVHFYSASDAEFLNTLDNLAGTFTYDGIAYRVQLAGTEGSVPLYRFYNAARGVHFYTASEAEKSDVVQNHSDVYRFEGVAYSVRIDGRGTPVHRYYVPARNTHFYTADTSEISLNSGLSDSYHYEGVGYWVGWRERK